MNRRREQPTGVTIALVLLGLSVAFVSIGFQALYADPITKPIAGYEAQASRPGNLQCSWRYARNVNTTGYIDSNDTAPEPNEATWQNTGEYFTVPYDWSYVSTAFLCYGDGDGDGDPNTGTFDVNEYVVDAYGSWDHVASYSVAVGELEATHNPVTGAELNSGSVDPNESYKWAEGPFTSTTSYTWLSEPRYTGCSNGIGRCTYDVYGARARIIQVSNISAITRIYPIIKGR